MDSRVEILALKIPQSGIWLCYLDRCWLGVQGLVVLSYPILFSPLPLSTFLKLALFTVGWAASPPILGGASQRIRQKGREREQNQVRRGKRPVKKWGNGRSQLHENWGWGGGMDGEKPPQPPQPPPPPPTPSQQNIGPNIC